MAQVTTRETVLQELEGLAEDRIPEVLDFIRFLKSRQEAERAGNDSPLPLRKPGNRKGAWYYPMRISWKKFRP